MIYNYDQENDYYEDGHDFLRFKARFQSSGNETNETVHLQVESSLGKSTSLCTDNRLDMFQFEDVHALSFWMEGVCQFTVGSVGIICNLLAIPLLCGPVMKSVFNKLLICLLTLHTMYIGSVLLIEIMWPAWKNEPRISEAWFIISFSFVLHPLRQFMLYSSTFITVLIARQRYIAIRHPIQYRNTMLSTNPWIPATKSLIFVLVTAALFTFPLFLETSVHSDEVGRVYDINGTHFRYVSFIRSYIIIKQI